MKLKRGRCPCPIHGGDNPQAFSVKGGKGWHCHTGCGGTGGDGVDFVRRIRFSGLPEKEGRLAALRELAPLAGVTLEPWQGSRREPRQGSRQGPRTATRRKGGTPGIARHATLPENANTGHGSRPERARSAPKPLRTPEQTPEERRQGLEAVLQECRSMGYVVQRAPDIHAAVLEVARLGPRGADYLASRGLPPAAAELYGFRSLDSLGGWRGLEAVLRASYLPEEREAAGWHSLPWAGKAPALVIPFRHRGEVVALRFRRLDTDEQGEKYRALSGVTIAQPFNADALEDLNGADLHIAEGELNAYALTLHGLRAIGLPGAGKWRDEWAETIARAAEGSEAGRLVAWYDSDTAGENGKKKLAGALQTVRDRAWLERHARAVELRGADANELHRTGKLHAFTERATWRD